MTLDDALQAALATSQRSEQEVWVARSGETYVVCTYTAFPEGAEIVCTLSAAAALTKFWNEQKPKRRIR